jgi:hypothetical protein
VRLHRAVIQLAERRAFQHPARHGPDGAGANPRHAFQEVPSIELFFIVAVFHVFLHQGRRKSAPHTSSPPTCPVAATAIAALAKAMR